MALCRLPHGVDQPFRVPSTYDFMAHPQCEYITIKEKKKKKVTALYGFLRRIGARATTCYFSLSTRLCLRCGLARMCACVYVSESQQHRTAVFCFFRASCPVHGQAAYLLRCFFFFSLFLYTRL